MSPLHFPGPFAYFSVMPNRAILATLLAVVTGCTERERFTIPIDPGDSEGPVTTIVNPSTDTVLTAGDPFILDGRSVDPTGIDTVYFDLFGSVQGFLPSPGHGEDTVSFGLPISTAGLGGTTLVVRVRAVDLLGNTGVTAQRQLGIQ